MNVALGTDGVAGNNDLNPPGKGVAGDPGTLPERQVLHMVTLGDTRALELGEKTGSLVAGKAVDINTIDHPAPADRGADTQTPYPVEWHPRHDPGESHAPGSQCR